MSLPSSSFYFRPSVSLFFSTSHSHLFSDLPYFPPTFSISLGFAAWLVRFVLFSFSFSGFIGSVCFHSHLGLSSFLYLVQSLSRVIIYFFSISRIWIFLSIQRGGNRDQSLFLSFFAL